MLNQPLFLDASSLESKKTSQLTISKSHHNKQLLSFQMNIISIIFVLVKNNSKNDISMKYSHKSLIVFTHQMGHKERKRLRKLAWQWRKLVWTYGQKKKVPCLSHQNPTRHFEIYGFLLAAIVRDSRPSAKCPLRRACNFTAFKRQIDEFTNDAKERHQKCWIKIDKSLKI